MYRFLANIYLFFLLGNGKEEGGGRVMSIVVFQKGFFSTVQCLNN